MKRNTGCSHGRKTHPHKACPPMQACDTAKTHDHFCTATVTAGTFTEVEKIIGDVTINTNVEADICLPSSAYEIKNIRKNVYITQCKAIPVTPAPGATTVTAANLFIEGYVHKNIQYSEGCDGYLKDYSINIPFKCYQPVGVTGTALAPIFVRGFSQKSSEVQEIREIAPDGMGSDRCSFGSRHFENFNEPIKCRILNDTILEMDFPHDFDRWGNFRRLTEKMTLTFTVRLTQVQRNPTLG
ncbi:CsxC family protein [Neobacillus mesonae]|uniref:CsxC family protein n=1 Tax=Neobacillus mesonae TaxID=1193713 RepID=UPI0025746078|nr:hypothetical protein [Neobacillus mesonae]